MGEVTLYTHIGPRLPMKHASGPRWQIGMLSPNNQRQHRALHFQMDVLPYALR